MSQHATERLAEQATLQAASEAADGADAAAKAALLGDFGIGPEDVEDFPSTEAPQDANQAAEQTDEETYSLDPELPEDIQEDLELEDEPELEAVEEDEPYQEVDEDEEYADEAVLAERRKNKKLSKELAYIKKQKLSTDRKAWVEKDAEFFPLADAKGIAERASSRREFRRLAKAEHERLKPLFLAQVKRSEDTLRGQHSEQAAKAWGKPMAGPPIPSSAQHQLDRVEEARKTGSLIQTIKARMLAGEDQ